MAVSYKDLGLVNTREMFNYHSFFRIEVARYSSGF